MLKLFLKNVKGFTLVELMVVVVILGILTSIAIPMYNTTQDRARLRACHANQRIIEGAAQQLVAEDKKLQDCGNSAQVYSLLKDYLHAEPKCPGGGEYSLTSTGTVSCTATGHYHYLSSSASPSSGS